MLSAILSGALSTLSELKTFLVVYIEVEEITPYLKKAKKLGGEVAVTKI